MSTCTDPRHRMYWEQVRESGWLPGSTLATCPGAGRVYDGLVRWARNPARPVEPWRRHAQAMSIWRTFARDGES